MAFQALAAGISVLLIGCCAINIRRTGPVKPVHVKSRLSRTISPEATATSPLPDQHSRDTTFNDSSKADMALNNEVHHKMTESGTNSHHSASETKHDIYEEKEGELLNDGAENDTKSVSEELANEGLPSGSVTWTVQNAAGAADKKQRGGSSVNALYALYSLISYVASANDDYNPKTKPKKSGIADISSLHVLYSLFSYVVHTVNLDEVNNETNGDNTTQTSAGVSRFTALRQEWNKESAKESETSNLWTSYLIIAVSVVAAVALIIVLTTCLNRNCRRASTHTVGHRVVVRGVGSPSI